MHKTIIIAEAGVNHNGSLKLAKELALEAKNCGADYIKYQTFKAESLVNKFAEQAEYQKRNLGISEINSQLEMLKDLEISYADFKELKFYCETIGIKFLSSPFEIESIDFLSQLGMDYIKIPSGEITNLPYLRKVVATGIPIILSTGMCSMSEVEKTVDILLKEGIDSTKITLLQCNTEYPTPFEDVNLKAMLTLKERFNVKVGYSDHTAGIAIPIAAVALGACIIEKHFTLDKNLPGPDHIASLEPGEFKAMVEGIRETEMAIGTGIKEVSQSEKKNKNIARKSIVAAKDIKKGEKFTEQNITVKRPGTGISPMMWDDIIGKCAVKNFAQDELIEI